MITAQDKTLCHNQAVFMITAQDKTLCHNQAVFSSPFRRENIKRYLNKLR